MKKFLHFAILYLFIEIVSMQYYEEGYGNDENPNYDYLENAQYPEENYYPNDEPINGEEYPNDEYPENNYPNGHIQYPEYPINEDKTIGDDNLYPEYPNYPQNEKYSDYPNEDYQYPEYPSYLENAPSIYPQNKNYRNPGRQTFNDPSRNQMPFQGQNKQPQKIREENKNSGNNEIFEILKQILQTQKNENKKGNIKGKSDSSDENNEIKDLLPILSEIINGKEPDFGKIASKLGQNGLNQIEKLIDKNVEESEDNVGGNIAKAGFGIIKNILKN